MTDAFDPARLDAIRSRQVTAFDKAREIVEVFDHPLSERSLDLDHAYDVAKALLAYEPTPDATQLAQEIGMRVAQGGAAARWRNGEIGDGSFAVFIGAAVGEAIARATAASEARVRAAIYEDLGKLKWIGSDKGWDLAIEKVRECLANGKIP